MENIVVSRNSLFWSKLGKWQSLMISLVLLIFFIALQFTSSDKLIATAIAALALTLIVLISVINDTFTSALIIYAFVIAILTVFTTVAALTIPSLALFPACISVIIIAFAANEAKKNGIKKWSAWLSFLMEFLLIFLFMWLVH